LFPWGYYSKKLLKVNVTALINLTYMGYNMITEVKSDIVFVNL